MRSRGFLTPFCSQLCTVKANSLIGRFQKNINYFCYFAVRHSSTPFLPGQKIVSGEQLLRLANIRLTGKRKNETMTTIRRDVF